MSSPDLPDLPELRPGDLSDLDALCVLEAGAFAGDRFSRRSWRGLLGSPSARVRLMCQDGRLIGATALLLRRDARVARLYSLAIDPARRGQGLGALLLADCEAAARAAGRREIRLEVRADNAAARSLYDKAGYRVRQRAEAYYADGTAALRLAKVLAS